MNEPTYTLLHKDAIEALRTHHLHTALQHISGMLFNVNDWTLRTEYDEILQTYELMLNFMRQGTTDPERHTMYQHLLQRSYTLADKLLRDYKKSTSGQIFYEKLRTQEALLPPPTFDTLGQRIEQLQAERDKVAANQTAMLTALDGQLTELYGRLFAYLWTADTWRDEDGRKAVQMVKKLGRNEQAVCISAVTLSLLEAFDYNRLFFLFDACRYNDELVRQRALTGAILAYIRHASRLREYPELCFLIDTLAENEQFAHDLCTLQMQLFLTLETRTVERKMREEIIPELMKSKRFRPTKFGFEEVDDALNQEDANPDWKQEEIEQKLNKNLMEIAQMQQEGVDLYMGTFAQLKNFPFFQEPMNWFYPFDTHHPALRGIFDTTDGQPSLMMRAFFNSGTLCNSDKYSFCFMTRNIPPEQREMMEDKINSAITDESEGLLDKLSQKQDETADDLRKTYIQDLYRFFKLYRRREDFDDPFHQNLYLFEYDEFTKILNTPECLHRLADFMLHRKYYTHAVELFEKLNEQENATAETFQKMGYGCQMDGEDKRAIGYYQQADILKPNSEWTLRHMAQCHRHLGQAEQALECYLKLEEMNPENLQLLMRSGECQVLLRQYDEAFARFFKVDYLQPNNPKAARAIAWCSFLTGKMEQAEKYYQRLLDGQPNAEDYLNAGHTAWACGNVPLAVERYRKHVELLRTNPKTSNATIDFTADRRELNERGITDEEIELMRDALDC